MSVNLGGNSGSGGSRSGGRRRGLRQRASSGAMAEINVTNLVDVILVILIIFMVSAPLLQSGINVDLPKSNSAVVTPDEEGVVITIERKNGKDGIYVAGVWARLENFETHLEAELKKAATKSVYLQADSLVQYGTVINVITRLKEVGVDNLGLMTAPLVENKKK